MIENQGGTGAVTASAGSIPEFSPSVKKLIGTYERNLDAKYRIGLPLQYREKFNDSPLIMLRWLNRSLALLPECNWLPLAEAIARLDLYSDFGMTVRRQMFAHAREIPIDKEGRIIVPTDMVDYARLDGKVMLMGDYDKIIMCNFVYYRDQIAADDVQFTERFPSVLQLAKGQKRLDEIEAELKVKPTL